MSFHSFVAEDFENWRRGIKHEHTKPGWHMHDQAIRLAVQAYANFHRTRCGYIGPSWQLIKAQLWVEGGGPKFGEMWRLRPMQIGNPGDTGIIDVCTHKDMPLIAPPEMRRNFNLTAIRLDPALSIQAGLALLHLKMAFITRKSSFTLLSDIEPGATSPRTDKPRFLSPQKAPKPKRYIAAWTPFCPVSIYQRYNIGDAAYASKLEYCLQLIGS